MIRIAFVTKQKKILQAKQKKYESFNRKNEPIHAYLKTNNSLPFIEAAIKRIEEGSYGICIDCEKEISIQRLKAVPGAIRCTFCQESDDLRGNNDNRRRYSDF